MKNDWQREFRTLFPNCEKRVYLEAAVFNGGNLIAERGCRAYFDQCCEGILDGKHQWNEAADETRGLIAGLLGGVDPSGIAFTKNTVEGLNMIAQGFDFKPGDNVVTGDIEHSSNVFPWLELKKKGVEVRIARAKDHRLDPKVYEPLIDGRTRIVAVSHVQAPTGYLHDLKALADMAHAKGAFLVVDAIQSMGLVPFKASEWGVDAVCAGCHKGLLCYPGVGFMYLGSGMLNAVRPVFAGANRAMAVDKDKWENVCADDLDAAKFEMSNLNYQGIYTLRECVRYIDSVGVENIRKYIMPLSDRLNRGLRDIGYEVATPAEAARRSNINSVVVPDPGHMRGWFMEKNIWISKMDAGYIRFSMGAFTSEEEVDKALDAAEEYYKTFVV